jgi:hypothetical protein
MRAITDIIIIVGTMARGTDQSVILRPPVSFALALSETFPCAIDSAAVAKLGGRCPNRTTPK